MSQIELTNFPLYFSAKQCTALNPSVAPLSVQVENLPVTLDSFLSHFPVSHQSRSLFKSTTFRCVGSNAIPKAIALIRLPPSLSQTILTPVLLYFLHPVFLLSYVATSPNLKFKYHIALLRMQNAKYPNCP